MMAFKVDNHQVGLPVSVHGYTSRRRTIIKAAVHKRPVICFTTESNGCSISVRIFYIVNAKPVSVRVSRLGFGNNFRA